MARTNSGRGCGGCLELVFVLVVFGLPALVVFLLTNRSWIPTIIVGILTWILVGGWFVIFDPIP